jgi:hypothetical protein
MQFKRQVIALSVLLAALVGGQQAFSDATQGEPPPGLRGVPASLQDGHGYINSDGNWVHSPVHTTDGSPPAGASAQCRDGTYSFSLHHQGTCSHHGGVDHWL